ncbi:MAG: HIT domain-containing protein, partial [Deltaproteobacteria bacterium]|nr:HIT domain-containing protein [Deltaproteobacteria bacterium]
LTINPIRPGHTLVVPRLEVDHWIDLPPELALHLMGVAQQVGKAIQTGFRPTRVGLIVAGIEVPHVHLHVVPVHDLRDFDFSHADKNPKPEALDAAARTLRERLREMGCVGVSD